MLNSFGQGKTEFPPWTATDIGQLKSLSKQKAGVKKIAKALNRTRGATTVKVMKAKVAIISK
jgi:hypothetical protein